MEMPVGWSGTIATPPLDPSGGEFSQDEMPEMIISHASDQVWWMTQTGQSECGIPGAPCGPHPYALDERVGPGRGKLGYRPDEKVYVYVPDYRDPAHPTSSLVSSCSCLKPSAERPRSRAIR
jgi:hypothetical protein